MYFYTLNDFMTAALTAELFVHSELRDDSGMAARNSVYSVFVSLLMAESAFPVQDSNCVLTHKGFTGND